MKPASESGPGAAHVTWNMFGARGPLRAPEGDGAGGDGGVDVDVSDLGAGGSSAAPKFTPEQQRYVNQLAARARAEGRNAAKSESRLDRIESAIEKLAGAITQQPTQQPMQQNPSAAAAIIAAPSAPARVGGDIPTNGGMVDIWNLSLEQVKQLGPAGLRVEHEKILRYAREKSGAPPVPSVLKKKG